MPSVFSINIRAQAAGAAAALVIGAIMPPNWPSASLRPSNQLRTNLGSSGLSFTWRLRSSTPSAVLISMTCTPWRQTGVQMPQPER